jgi:hypothetical protein
MKDEYDFSTGEKGKFYRDDIQIDLPIYLEPDVADFLNKIATRKGIDVATIVNDWIKKDIALIETAMGSISVWH